MNIYLISNAYNIGGGERNLIDLANELKSRKCRVLVLLPRVGDFSKKLKSNNIEYYVYGDNIPFERRWMNAVPLFIDIIPLYRIATRCCTDKPDLIYCNTATVLPLGYMLSVYYKCKICWICHGPWEIPGKIKSFVIDRMVDYTNVITPALYKDLFCKTKKLVPLGIRDRVVKYNNTTTRRKIICVGRFEYIKGQDLLVDAFYEMKNSAACELHFFGGIISKKQKDIHFFQTVKKMVSSYGMDERVYFHGYKDNVRSCS